MRKKIICRVISSKPLESSRNELLCIGQPIINQSSNILNTYAGQLGIFGRSATDSLAGQIFDCHV